MKIINSIWAFFASVKLALFTLCALASTSIIGTLIPQQKSEQFYVEWSAGVLAKLFEFLPVDVGQEFVHNFGVIATKFFIVFDIPDMYSAWWFVALLWLLSVNLVICSFDRFPGVWKQVKADGLVTPVKRLEKMGRKKQWQISGSLDKSVSRINESLTSLGWKYTRKAVDGGTLLFSQKGAWSRTGVYIVHASILVIFVGAIIGNRYGFKGSAMIPETQQTDKIFAFNTGEPIDLGFAVRCDRFTLETYPDSGMAKEYESILTVIDKDKSFQTRIEVNSPLTYKGITFYQSSYQGFSDFLFTITNVKTGKSKSFISGYEEETRWLEEDLTFGAINVEVQGQSVSKILVWFSDNKEDPTEFVLENGKSKNVSRQAGEYVVEAKQMFATGLQVSKDPGVWVVYFGCALMLCGLIVAFFLSHRRIWVYLKEDNGNVKVLAAGSANKNRVGFEKVFAGIVEKLQQIK